MLQRPEQQQQRTQKQKQKPCKTLQEKESKHHTNSGTFVNMQLSNDLHNLNCFSSLTFFDEISNGFNGLRNIFPQFLAHLLKPTLTSR